MAVMDEFKEARTAIKKSSLKEKWQYFWDYYRWTTFWVIVGVATIVSLSVDILSKDDYALYATFVNSLDVTNDDALSYRDGFLQAADLDIDEYDVIIDTSLYLERNPSYTSEVELDNISNAIDTLMALASAGELDVLTADMDVYELYAYSDWFFDLRNILTEEQLARYSQYFYYIDKYVLNLFQEATAENDQQISMPDPAKPEEMVEPIPVGIFLSGDNLPESFFDYFKFKSIPVVFGIPVSSNRVEAATAFLDYMTGNEVPQLAIYFAE